ncbi:protein RGF1 INDUCIBLE TRANSCRIPTION FACTOR 1-like [Lycium ferocissimum]|uniref:protein RGF1 INDUCIBLE TRANSCRIPTION FACTOR 1-like n=1 Tax=Lycium ferocissimum TaxID=112874 RepID=UPI0028151EF4|nr:protein RGF1 INDUCIBLE TRANSCRIPTION FACTOR 1-like [Lycium ferocissimum]
MKAGSGSISIVPRWLEVLLALKFFNACSIHELERRNEENVFCLDCCVGLCIHCMPSHRGHKILQIRRYVYQDVLCLKDANKLLDCSFVQSYTTNSAKVVFLHQRPLSSQFKGSNYNCILCHRSLQRPNIFCSISCKVQHMVSCSNVNLIIKYQKVTSKCESSMDFMDDQRTPNCQSMVTESVKTQHTSLNVSTCLSKSDGSCTHRRKGTPQRLCEIEGIKVTNWQKNEKNDENAAKK